MSGAPGSAATVATRTVMDGGAVLVVVVVVVCTVEVTVVLEVVVVVVVGGRVLVLELDVVVDVELDVLELVVVVGGAGGGVTVRPKVPCAPSNPSTTMKYVCPAVTVDVMREPWFAPVAIGHASSPAGGSSSHVTSVPSVHPRRR